EAVIENNRLYGRGAADMKGGIAAMLGAVEAVVNSNANLHGSIVFTGVMDEETTGMGTQAIMDRGIKADAAVIGEPTNLEVEIAHKGSLWLEITTRGKAVHASTIKHGDPIRGVNAIAKMARIIAELDKLLITLEKTSHPLVGNATVSVGTITGGTKTNIVADSCSITVDRRLLPEDDWSKAYHQIDKLIQKLKEEDPLLQADLRLIMRREGAEISPEETIAKLALKAVGTVKGTNPNFTGCRATTDMSILMKQGGIPTILLGPGNLEQAHVADEYVKLPQLTQAAKIYAHIICNLLNAQ
ncbi:MAG: M20 family metallopeptidase, partial [Candidatus Bathyarchaeia archaeon]